MNITEKMSRFISMIILDAESRTVSDYSTLAWMYHEIQKLMLCDFAWRIIFPVLKMTWFWELLGVSQLREPQSGWCDRLVDTYLVSESSLLLGIP